MAELEGFLCPLCRQDCGSVQDLETHYRVKHGVSTGSKFKRAFKISPKQNRAELAQSQGASASGDFMLEHVTNVSGINTDYWGPQEMGNIVDHSLDFRRVRGAYLADVAVETNKVVIRVEKLFRMLQNATPRTAKQMKSMEQNVVPWKKDKDEKRCGGCGSGFGLVRRKHHCRLCGNIRCKECCNFMTLTDTYPLLHDCPDYASLAPPATTAPKKGFKDDEASNEIRMCASCRKLVARRLSHLGTLKKSGLEVLYDKLRATMAESEARKPTFIDVAQAIWTGEHAPLLQEATVQRQELLQIYETIDAISKRILSMGASDPSPRGQKLVRSIRAYVSHYLQEHLLTLPALPTTQQLAEIKERKEKETQEKLLEIERQREQQRRQNLAQEAAADGLNKIPSKFASDMDKLFSVNTIREISKELKGIIPTGHKEGGLDTDRTPTGAWMCDTNQVMTTADLDEDPFQVQYEQLLSYIAQARHAKRFDEVHALEESLKEIRAVIQEQKMSYGFSGQTKP